jgi:hypothetical protein
MALALAEYEHRSLPFGKFRERPGQRPPPLARQQRGLGRQSAGHRDGLVYAFLERHHPALPASARLDPVEASIDQDAREPDLEGKRLAKRREVRVSLDERVLDRLVRLGTVAQVVKRDARRPALMARHEFAKPLAGPRMIAGLAQRLDGDGRERICLASGNGGSGTSGACHENYARPTMVVYRERAILIIDQGMPNRRAFLSRSVAAAAGVLAPNYVEGLALTEVEGPALSKVEGQRGAGPRAHEFVFARLRYTSGDWDYNPKVAANVLNSLVEYTTIPVYPEEVVISADSQELLAFPFLFMTGHKLVRFSRQERERMARFVEQGGLLFSDDCNHDIEGLYARSFEEEMRTIFPGPRTLAKLPGSHPIYRSFFPFPEGPPATSHELNGWGDEIVHDYLRGVEGPGSRRLGVLYSNKDYGCEWDYDWRNKRFQRDDNTKFAVNIVVYAMTS